MSVAGGAVLHAMSGLLQQTSQGLSGPIGRSIDYATNSLFPNLLPQPGEIWQLYQQQRISSQALHAAMYCWGIDIDGTDPRFHEAGLMWQRSFAAKANQLTTDEIYRISVREGLSQQQQDTLFRRAGYYEPEVIGRIKTLRAPLIDTYTLFQLYNRKLIPPARYSAGLAELGWDVDQLSPAIDQLRYQIPPFSDLPRFMIRDIFDPAIVQAFELDSEFTDKFQGRLKDWAEWQGITPEVMLAYWRAHWANIAPTQLYEMFHRLRPGRVPANLVTTEVDARRALAVNDILPFWRDRLISINYRLLTRVDIRRVYNSGLIPRAEVTERYRDLGYDQPTSEALTSFADVERRRYVSGLAGLMTPKEALRLFQRYELSELELRRVLVDNQLPGEAIDRSIKDAQLRRDAAVKRSCLAAMRKRYLTGTWTIGEANTILLLRGYQPQDTQLILDGWQCELTARGKLIPATTLCSWYEKGLIDANEYTTRLVSVGYSTADALRVLETCDRNARVKQQRQAESMARKKAADIKRQQKEQEAKARQVARDAAAVEEAAEKDLIEAQHLKQDEMIAEAKVKLDEARAENQKALAALNAAKARKAEQQVTS